MWIRLSFLKYDCVKQKKKIIIYNDAFPLIHPKQDASWSLENLVVLNNLNLNMLTIQSHMNKEKPYVSCSRPLRNNGSVTATRDFFNVMSNDP